MSRAHLQADGYHPSPALPAQLNDYQLHVCERATIVPKVGEVVYGMLMDLPSGEASALYSSPDLKNYQPQLVDTVRLHDKKEQQALCYVVPLSAVERAQNRTYAESLSSLLLSLGFPETYVAQLNDERE